MLWRLLTFFHLLLELRKLGKDEFLPVVVVFPYSDSQTQLIYFFSTAKTSDTVETTDNNTNAERSFGVLSTATCKYDKQFTLLCSF